MRTPYLIALLLLSVSAHAQHTLQQIAEDATRHQALSETMVALSRCYTVGQNQDACVAQAKSQCVGLAIGKNCGLRDEAMADPAQSYGTAAKAQAAVSQCLTTQSKPYEECLWDLQNACKGIGVGKFCGMVHAHSF